MNIEIEPNSWDIQWVIFGRAYSMPGLALVVGLALAGLSQGGCDDEQAPPAIVGNPNPRGEDAGEPPPPPDAGPDIIRDPNANRDVPPELKDQKCAVEVDKLYELSVLERQPEPTQLAADVVNSRFSVGYVGSSDRCIDAFYLARLQGSSESGKPTIENALDPCTQIQRVALAHNGSSWLLASVDTRMGAQDLWVQSYGEDGTLGQAHRVSDTTGPESEPVLAMNVEGKLLTAWAERNALADSSQLFVRVLSADGEPVGDVVTLEDAKGTSFASLSLSPVGSVFALGYRRTDTAGTSRIILDALDPSSGERVRDPWTLTAQAGAVGTVDVTGDEDGGGVAYSVIAVPSYQVWFQALGRDGQAAPVVSAGREGGPSAATRVVGPPSRATDASVTKVFGGYALAYRALSGGLVREPQIRVHFLDPYGREGGVSSVALAAEFGGRTGIATGYDGRVVVAWNDATESGGTKLMAIRLPCIAEN